MFGGRLGVLCGVRLKSMRIGRLVGHQGHAVRCNGGCKPCFRKIKHQLVYDLVLIGIRAGPGATGWASTALAARR
jgi:hypothetical protein